MNCLIIEDEKIAAKRLTEVIEKCDSSFNIVDIVQSVKKSVEWFESGKADSIDIVFMDIQLSDGLSFEIFEQTEVKTPIIFTTAYDEYALKAFKVNSIDYLLKPIDEKELCDTLNKFKQSRSPKTYPNHIFDSVLKGLTNNYKKKFVIKVGEHIKVISIEEVQCFYSMEKSTFLQNQNGRDFAISHSLDQLEELLDPQKFFRINRGYIVAFSAIKDIISYSNSRLLLKLATNSSDELIVSRDRMQKFRDWLEN
jgi:two-component system, LytTR family, response regulator LytT